jgi:O-antigen ligase
MLAVAIGVVCASLIPVVAGHISKRLVIFGLAGFACLLLAMATRELKSILLFAFIAALSYYRTYFLRVFGDFGGYGTYWLYAYLALVGMLFWWAYESSFLKRHASPKGPALWPFWAPFVVVSTVASFASGEFGLAMTDIVRVLIFGLILWYIRFQVGPKEWWWCVAALGFVIVAQSLFGVVQVTTGKFAPGGQDAGEFRRATGTMVHPNILAPYLLALVPIFFSLAATAPTRLLRNAALLTALIGSLGVACTMSRAPWILLAAEFVAVLAGLTVFRVIKAQQAIGLLAIAVLAVLIALAPFAQKISDRMLSNIGESITFRAQLNRVALAMFSDRPMLGIGLNRFTAQLPHYDPNFAQSVTNVEQGEEVYARAIAAVHNFYLLILAETGATGLGAMVAFLAGALCIGVRAVRATAGPWRGACFGMLIGLIALLLEEFSDFSLWIDPGFFTLALIVGLLNNAPALATQAVDTHVLRTGRPVYI